jgi:hypothetical protein
VERYCIIGAGPAGLAQARAFRRAGIPFDLFERHRGIGGLWDIENPGTPIYDGCRTITSKRLSAFFDFPMPESFPDYPDRARIHTYLRDFARAFGLLENIRLGCEISSMIRDGDKWRVRLAGGATHSYSGVVCANGINWEPLRPRYPGEFSGEIRHAVEFFDGKVFAGRRVLIVGGGNTGCDIACAAAREGAAAYLSLRRGYHIVPKHVFGVPADIFAERSPALPLRIRHWAYERLLRLILGDTSRLGWPTPAHRILESHPIINGRILSELREGRLVVKPDVRRFDHDVVEFTDGSREQVDLVLFATGYKMSLPFADRSLFEWKGEKVDAYLSVFNRRYDTLFTQGYLVTNAGVFEDFDRLAHLVVCYIRDRHEAPEKAARFRRLVRAARPDLSGGIEFIDSPRHDTYVEHKAFRRAVERTRLAMGWPELSKGRVVQRNAVA